MVNPIVSSGADPWVIRWNGIYYYCHVRSGRDIHITRSDSLGRLQAAPSSLIWTPPAEGPYSHNVWAPELHWLDGAWHIYFAADDGNNSNHRMYVLRGSSQDPLGEYEFVGPMSDPGDGWAIDGTVLSLPDGGRYFVWSGWEGADNVAQNLYIAPMEDAVTVSQRRVCISRPEHPWEKVGRPHVNEGPQALWHEDKLFLIYSASGSWTDDYCLGRLDYVGGDVCTPEAWLKQPDPVFSGANGVTSPGHACFVLGDDDWIVYHAAKRPGAGWDREVRAQRFTWKSDGSPNFGEPVASGVIVQ